MSRIQKNLYEQKMQVSDQSAESVVRYYATADACIICTATTANADTDEVADE